MKPGLFVYGTLHPDRAPDEIRDAVSHLTRIGSGTVQGRLLDLGEYPGLVFEGELTPVSGEVFALPDDAETLPALDAYEGFDENNHANSLFVRERCDITMGDGTTERHWVYLYNRRNAPSQFLMEPFTGLQ
jgi:gamma-glutamylcyclotransferase (GGCT)/AIG2-like uncharacterized protein YtfP